MSDLVLEKSRRGRPTRESKLTPVQRQVAEDAALALTDAATEMQEWFRKRVPCEEVKPVDARHRRKVADCLTAALSAGLTWRQIAECMGTCHQSAHAWWKRWGGDPA